ncbi:MAG: DDE-type integrase/transposase/recombinase [Rhodomicrobium sp.]
MAGRISMSARREITAAVAERYRLAVRVEKGRILDELCKVTGWHRKHAVRALAGESAIERDGPRQRKPAYGAIIKDALVALWEASDRICGKRLKVMIPTLLPALERHGRLKLDKAQRALMLGVSAATIDRLLIDTKIAAAGGKRRRVGFYSAVRREVPVRTFNDWNDPAPGFCEVDMVAHGGTSVAGSFIQTLTMVDVATGWTECMPLVTRESGLVVQAMERAQSLFPWLVLGADFDNDSAFMNEVVVPWCRAQKIEVTRSRAYKKNDQAFVEQKNGAVVRRLVGYGRFEGIETARILVRLYAASRLHTNFFQPSFKLKDKRREGAKVIKRYHAPATPYARALAHPKLSKAVKKRLRELYRTLDPVALLAEIRDAQTELGTRVDARAGKIAATSVCAPSPDAAAFAKGLGKNVLCGEQRAIHRRLRKPYKKRVRMPSMLDPHIEDIERWLAAEPRLTALVILGRLAERCPGQFGPPQHTIVQRLLKALRRMAAGQLMAAAETVGPTTSTATVHGTIEASSTSAITPSAARIAATLAWGGAALGNIVR